MIKKVLTWFCIYLLITFGLSTVIGILSLLYTFFPTELLGTTIFLISTFLPILLIGIGIVSILPLSEYAYMRQAASNPAIAREAVHHQRRKPERRELGVVLGLVGVTFFLGIYLQLFSFAESLLDTFNATILATVFLIALIIIYKRSLHQYIKSED